MKIYVAGKFEEKERILEIYSKLKALGHTVAYDWTTHKYIQPYKENQNMAARYSENELTGISQSDVFIYLSHDQGHTLHMEFGAALILNKKFGKPTIFVIGDCSKSPWYFNPRVKRRDSVEEVLAELEKLKC